MRNPLVHSFLGFSCLFASVIGSVIVVETSPDAFLPPLAKYLTLRCSLNDTDSTSAIIGRDVTSTSDDVHHVTSLVVMRQDGVHVASVSTFGNATALVDRNNLQVSGDVSSNSGERAYIELTWTYPSEPQSGAYKCEVNGVSDQGHSVVFSKSVEIGSSDPSMTDLAKYIHDLQLKADQFEKEKDDMKAELERQKHIERGQLHCGDSSTWKDTTGDYSSKHLSQQFSKSYTKPPIVYLSVYLYDDEHLINTRYLVELIGVDENGFSMACRTWAGSHIFKMYVDWISFPQ